MAKSTKKSGLGRGLSSLIGDNAEETLAASQAQEDVQQGQEDEKPTSEQGNALKTKIRRVPT